MPLYSAVTISASVMQKRALGEMSTVLERSGTGVNTRGFRLGARWNRLGDGENAQKTGENGEKMGEIQPKTCEGRELSKNQLAGQRAQVLQPLSGYA